MPNPGLPNPATVVETRELVIERPDSPPGPPQTIRILRTNQADVYEPELPLTAVLASRLAVVGDDFGGTARRVAKISIADAATEDFEDLQHLIISLTSDRDMIRLDLPDDRDSDRVKEEQRNVRVRAFIYAASREADNDFHVIIGRDPDQSRLFMNVEVSGLPPSSSPHRATLNAVRDGYKTFFKNHPDNLPGTSYDFYDPPIPVFIGGSLFFDVTHASGGKPGPKDLRDDIPTIWEIHPVTRIEFEPE